MIYTFFGHRDTPDSVRPILEALLSTLIENDPQPLFYVGTHGKFDHMALHALRRLQSIHPKMKYAVVLSRIPGRNTAYNPYSASETVLPDGIESVPPRFAIRRRNQWMLSKADTVITYVQHSFGNAYEADQAARRHGKHVITLSTPHSSIPSSAQATEMMGESDRN